MCSTVSQPFVTRVTRTHQSDCLLIRIMCPCDCLADCATRRNLREKNWVVSLQYGFRNIQNLVRSCKRGRVDRIFPFLIAHITPNPHFLSQASSHDQKWKYPVDPKARRESVSLRRGDGVPLRVSQRQGCVARSGQPFVTHESHGHSNHTVCSYT